MPWVTPITWTINTVITAARLNGLRDALRYLKGLDGPVEIEQPRRAGRGQRQRRAHRRGPSRLPAVHHQLRHLDQARRGQLGLRRSH